MQCCKEPGYGVEGGGKGGVCATLSDCMSATVPDGILMLSSSPHRALLGREKPS